MAKIRFLFMVTIRFFAIYREKAKVDKIEIALEESITVRDLLEIVKERIPSIKDPVMEGKGMVAVNQEVAKPDTIVNDGDEVALIPPVSGG